MQRINIHENGEVIVTQELLWSLNGPLICRSALQGIYRVYMRHA